MANPLRILVYGTTGSGKTSLCNTITGKKMPVSSSARGVTFQSYTYPSFYLDGRECIITDTVGLNESDKGTVPSKDALKSLVSLLKDSKEGYNLLIHVMRIPRITKAEHDNYQFFVNTVAQNKIPIILVATGCENIDPMNQWAIDNEHNFLNEKLVFKQIVPTCFAEGGPLEIVYGKLRDDSRTFLERGILNNAAEKSIKIYDSGTGLVSTLRTAWNWLCQWAGWDSLKIVANNALRELLIRLGFTDREATNLADEWHK